MRAARKLRAGVPSCGSPQLIGVVADHPDGAPSAQREGLGRQQGARLEVGVVGERGGRARHRWGREHLLHRTPQPSTGRQPGVDPPHGPQLDKCLVGVLGAIRTGGADHPQVPTLHDPPADGAVYLAHGDRGHLGATTQRLRVDQRWGEGVRGEGVHDVGGGESAPGVGLEHLLEQPRQPGRGRRGLGHRPTAGAQHARQTVGGAGQAAVQHLPGTQAQRVDVGRPGRGRALEALWRDVGHAPAGSADHPEVHQLDLPQTDPPHHDVGRLEIAVVDARRVHRGERVGEGHQHATGGRLGGGGLLDDSAERPAAGQLHHQVGARHHARVQQRRHVGVHHPFEGPQVAAGGLVDELQRAGRARSVAGAPHRPEAARAQPSLQDPLPHPQASRGGRGVFVERHGRHGRGPAGGFTRDSAVADRAEDNAGGDHPIPRPSRWRAPEP